VFEKPQLAVSWSPDKVTPPYPKDMPISAHDAAAVIRDRLPQAGAVKLHKLLYYCQGHHLATFDEPLFSEAISAWDMGPVVSSFRYEDSVGLKPRGEVRMSEAQLNTIEYVVSRYGKMTGRELAIMTHGETPWIRANDGRPEHGSTPIKQDWIKEYFKSANTADREDETPFDPAQVAELMAQAKARADARKDDLLCPDSLEDVLAWADR
jgi:uncharacterized phage-associated protein